ncbi:MULTISPECIES: oxygenase MpaB family protein [unclassified Mycobacterium]|uniref:oxygenase MpaB family protein n=1 Tax=unclassified Mycobacterium TaxID=2642494 RepID=UPI0008980ED0|nr:MULTISPECIES: oxygenase MpaB family protein [unclassified Mycobacterium]SEA30785.1 Uncharacterized conserved protein, DUF2236 family [Mycobacterium sp. 283mftsu]
MTKAVDSTHAADADTDADLLTTAQTIGKNHYPAGIRIPDRSSDDSLSPRDRAQCPVPPNSLVWKYLGDLRIPLSMGLRIAVIENMHPQLGQGVSDHSVLFSGQGNFLERGRRSAKPIQTVVYGDPEQARKVGIQVRNFHKSIKGDMPNGRKYHAINAETFYWAHATFFEAIFCASEQGAMARKLTRAEKEQIFEESKEWFSMYGVDDSAQPATYDEFERYLADIFQNQLVANGMSETSTTLAARTFSNKKVTRDIGQIQGVPQWVANYIIGPALPLIGAYVRLTTLGSMGPHLRELGKARWSERDERNYRRICTTFRVLTRFTDRFVPYRLYYTPEAVAGFRRAGIHPRDITLESARAALAAHRAEWAQLPVDRNNA